jgi:multidrug efflux system membrane fusion protein
VRQGGSGEYVFVLQDDRTVKLRPVVKGQPVGDRVQVTSGLAIGERVITEGADRLRDGARVMLPGDTPGGQGWQGGGGRRQRGQGAQPGASAPAAPALDALTGASAAKAPLPQSPVAKAPSPFAPASAAEGGGRQMTPEQRAQWRAEMEKLTPEEREARRSQRRAARAAGAGASGADPAQ